ncbi:MAG TPA: nucleotidyltransferase domain-containing protein, partial [Ktedonobacterales bacterium]|nr:nucleotidyltransferase domain-containing protein [Ktedonobacterales bacterium]
MGTELATPELARGPLVSWLDPVTDALVRDMILTLAAHRADLLAVILYGSVARRAERPLDDSDPSDVDLLLVFDKDDMHLSVNEGEDIFHTLGTARDRHLDAPREVQVMFASRTLDEWDPTFVENVAWDGLLLFARGPLPEQLAAVERRVPWTSDTRA